MRLVRTLPPFGLAYLFLGAALATAFCLLALVVTGGMLRPESSVPLPVGIVVSVVVLVLLVVTVGILPAVRRVEGVAAESMLGISFPGGPPGDAVRWRDRLRTVGWLVLHLLAGATTVIALVLGGLAAADRSAWAVAPAVLGGLALAALLVAALRGAAPALLGPSLRERLTALERESTRLGERNRLARELHDSVGHALSLVTVQAGAARRVQARDPQFVARALEAIEEASRRAAGELDYVLGLLRDDGSAQGRNAVPDLASVADLVLATRRAGLDVVLHDALSGDEHDRLSPVASREAYRVVQEGLANALRHGQGPCRVSIDRHGDELRIEVSNPLGETAVTRTAVSRMRRGGRGVLGIAERVETVGGTAVVGADGDQWRLRVALPWVAS